MVLEKCTGPVTPAPHGVSVPQSSLHVHDVITRVPKTAGGKSNSICGARGEGGEGDWWPLPLLLVYPGQLLM